MNLLGLIKTAGMDAVGATNPVTVMFGTITKTNPLEVDVEERFTLPEDFLVVTETAKELTTNDKVVLLRVQGGQQFVVIDKVVE
jgi:hypothetical protein